MKTIIIILSLAGSPADTADHPSAAGDRAPGSNAALMHTRQVAECPSPSQMEAMEAQLEYDARKLGYDLTATVSCGRHMHI